MKQSFILKFLSFKIFLFLIICLLLVFSADYSYSVSFKEETAEDYRAQGFQAQRDGNVYEALKNYSKAISLGSSGPETFNDMGVMFERSGILDKAEKAYLKAIELDPNFLAPYSNLGYFYKDQGQRESALEYFCKRYEKASLNDEFAVKIEDEILDLDPGKKTWIESLKAARFNQAFAERKNFRKNMMSYEPDVLFTQGVNFYADNDYETAYLAFKLASIKDPQNKKYQLAAFDAQEKLPVQSQYYMSEAVFPQGDAGLNPTSSGDGLDVWMSQPTIWKDDTTKQVF